MRAITGWLHASSPAEIPALARTLGLVGIVASCWMSYAFGSSMSGGHALALVLVTLLAPIALTYGRHEMRHGGKAFGALCIAAGAFFAIAEYGTHLAYTVGVRTVESKDTHLKNAVHAEAQESITDHRANLKLWRDQLAELTAANAWAATVTADGLKGELPAMDKAIELETARGGCKIKCKALMDQRAALVNRIATAEKRDDLTGRIEATQRLVDKAREAGAKTEYKHSKVVAQTDFIAQVAWGTLKPSADAQTWTQIAIAAFMALVSTLVPIVALMIGWSQSSTEAATPAAAEQPKKQPHNSANQRDDRYQTVVVRDIELARRIAAITAPMRGATAQAA